MGSSGEPFSVFLISRQNDGARKTGVPIKERIGQRSSSRGHLGGSPLGEPVRDLLVIALALRRQCSLALLRHLVAFAIRRNAQRFRAKAGRDLRGDHPSIPFTMTNVIAGRMGGPYKERTGKPHGVNPSFPSRGEGCPPYEPPSFSWACRAHTRPESFESLRTSLIMGLPENT